MRKIKKIGVVLITVMLIFTFFNNIYCANAGEAVLKSFSGKANPEGAEPLKKIMGTVLNVMRIAGAGIALIMVMVIGIKYAVASAGERADIKKYAITYATGALILFGASGILTIIRNVITSGLE